MKQAFGVAFVLFTVFSVLAQKPNKSAVVTEGIVMSGVNTSPTQAEIHYTKTINGNVVLTLRCKNPEYNFQEGLDCVGELEQFPEERSVFFDPQRVADKIIDRALVGPVTEACKAMIRIDQAYRAGSPASFTDSKGVLWVRGGRR